MNNLLKKTDKIIIDKSHYLKTDGGRGVCLVQHFPQKRISKEGLETEYTAEERFYFPTVAQALEKYTDLKQIILPQIVEMLEVQKETLEILKEFKNKYRNWE